MNVQNNLRVQNIFRVKENNSCSKEKECYNCGTAKHFIRDCHKLKKLWNLISTQKMTE